MAIHSPTVTVTAREMAVLLRSIRLIPHDTDGLDRIEHIMWQTSRWLPIYRTRLGRAHNTLSVKRALFTPSGTDSDTRWTELVEAAEALAVAFLEMKHTQIRFCRARIDRNEICNAWVPAGSDVCPNNERHRR